jgi:rhodanese-related sulfurtransferase
MGRKVLRALALLAGAVMLLAGRQVEAQAGGSIRNAVIGESGQPTSEISTEEMSLALGDGSTTVLDARPHAEYSVSHIPGAQNVAPKPGIAPSVYVSDVAEIGRLLHEDHAAPIVLYCNGPNCGKSKRLAGELVTAGYQKVRRYQLGIPVESARLSRRGCGTS